MSNTKETMNVITIGINNAANDEPSDVEELAGAITMRIAADITDYFMMIVKDMKTKPIQLIVKSLEEADPRSMVDILRALFLNNHIRNALKDLDVLEICQTWDSYSYGLFQECFLEDERIDWYCVENWLSDKNIVHNSKLS